jgi:hypothetical protein
VPEGSAARISFTRIALVDGELVATDKRDGDVQETWRYPVIEPASAFTQLVPTWHARTPGASWVEVSARVRTAAGWSRWLVLARWADNDAHVRPTSVPDEADGPARVDTDTVRLSEPGTAYQLQVSLLAPPGETAPELTCLAAMASGVNDAPSPPPVRAGHVLDVAPLSQRVHAGHYPQWGGGGSVWCSPTSVAMVLSYWGVGPHPESLDWVDPSYPDRAVCHAVRHCWDYAYDGAGNWSFNTAYAAQFGLDAFVTRLHDLVEAEAFLTAGIPLIASIVVNPARLPGADYDSDGHLVVIAGFTAEGDVVCNDPAAQDLTTLRRVYPRSAFDAAWRDGSGRLVYVLHPPAVALPPQGDEANW